MISFWLAKHFLVLQVGMITVEKAIVAGLWIDPGPLNKLAYNLLRKLKAP